MFLFCWALAHGQQAAVIQVDYTNPGLTPSVWKMTIHPDGSGEFESHGSAAAAIDARQSEPLQSESRQSEARQSEALQIQAGNVQRPIQLSKEFADHVFATARERKLFAFPCESHMKVAFQGKKRLSYTGPDGSGACEFNYSKDKEIQNLGNSLVSVEYTILSGARMEKLLQHDRLGLDAELGSLVTAVQDGNALEVGTIRETLTRIATDEQVLDRARKKARLLLTQLR